MQKIAVTQKTTMVRTEDATHNWHLIDAQGKVLGRFATEVARLLMGKNKPSYTPHTDAGEYVVITNAALIEVTGNKDLSKTYFSFSGYPSGLSKASFAEVLRKNPERVIREAVKRMLPDNKLRDIRLNRLKVFPGTEHTHASQLVKKA